MKRFKLTLMTVDSNGLLVSVVEREAATLHAAQAVLETLLSRAKSENMVGVRVEAPESLFFHA